MVCVPVPYTAQQSSDADGAPGMAALCYNINIVTDCGR